MNTTQQKTAVQVKAEIMIILSDPKFWETMRKELHFIDHATNEESAARYGWQVKSGGN